MINPNALQMDYVFELYHVDVVPLISNIKPDDLVDNSIRRCIRSIDLNRVEEKVPLRGVAM
jgi:hypothetical protein